MSTLTVQNIQGSSSSSNTINVASGHKISGAAGAISVPGTIVQTLQSIKTDTQVIASTFPSLTQISGLTVNITSQKANSKFLLSTSIVVGSAYYTSGFRFAKDGSAISPVGDASNSNTPVSWGFNFYDANNGHEDHNVAMVSYQYLYSSSAAAGTSIAFDVHGGPYSSDYVLTINRPNDASTAASRLRGTSQLLVQEIAT